MWALSTKNVLLTTLTITSAFGLVGCGGAVAPTDTSSRLQLVNQQLSLSVGTSSITVNPNLQLVATLAPPVVGGVTLQANDVQTVGVDTYVTYNNAGTGTGGGIDVVDISVPTIPALGSSTTYASKDINGLYVYLNNLYAVGQDSTASTPGILTQYSLGLLGSVTGLVTSITQPSYAGVSITGDIAGNYLYAVSGDDTDHSGAGLQVLNRGALTQVASQEILDARDVAVRASNGRVYVVAGQPGRLLEFSATGGALGNVSLGGASIPQSKSTVQVGSHYAVATSGEGGASIVCLDNMTVLANQVPPVATNGGTSVTNAAILTQGLLVTADGDQGVNVYAAALGATVNGTSCNSINLSFLGNINFGTSISANSIQYAAGLLFVGSGVGGYRIVSITVPIVTTGLLTAL